MAIAHLGHRGPMGARGREFDGIIYGKVGGGRGERVGW